MSLSVEWLINALQLGDMERISPLNLRCRAGLEPELLARGEQEPAVLHTYCPVVAVAPVENPLLGWE
jgi:hypothetical protein